jgi:hypothetical protein
MKALGATLIPVPYEIAWKALDERSFRELMEHSFIRSMTTISLPVTARWDWKFSKTPRRGRCHRQHWRRRINHGRGQRYQGAETGSKIFGVEPETCSAGSAFVRERFASGFSKLEIVIRGWRRRSKHVPSHVGTNETSRGRLPRCHSRGHKKCDATVG